MPDNNKKPNQGIPTLKLTINSKNVPTTKKPVVTTDPPVKKKPQTVQSKTAQVAKKNYTPMQNNAGVNNLLGKNVYTPTTPTIVNESKPSITSVYTQGITKIANSMTKTPTTSTPKSTPKKELTDFQKKDNIRYNSDKARYKEQIAKGSGISMMTESFMNNISHNIISGAATMLDIPDMLQTVTNLPSKYTLKDWKYTIQNAFNELEGGAAALHRSMVGDTDIVKKREKNYQQKKQDLTKKMEGNKAAESLAIKNNTYEKEKEDFWNSNIVGASINSAAKTVNAAAYLVDKHVFNDENNMSNAVLDRTNRVMELKNRAMSDAYSEHYTEMYKRNFDLRKDAVKKGFEQKLALAVENNPKLTEKEFNALQEKYKKEADAAFAEISKDQNDLTKLPTSIFKDEFDTDKRSTLEKLFDPKLNNLSFDAPTLSTLVIPQVAQGVADILTTKGLGAVAGKTAQTMVKGASAMGKGVQSTKAFVKTSKILENTFDAEKMGKNIASKLLKGADTGSKRLKALEGTTKGFSTITDKYNKSVGMFDNVLESIEKKTPGIAKQTKAVAASTKKSLENTKDKLKETVSFSTYMAMYESQQIGIDVYNTAVQSQLEKKIGSKEDFYKQFEPANGESFTYEEEQDIEAAYEKKIEEFSKANPKEFEDLLHKANEAGILAGSTNYLPEIISNTAMFLPFVGNKKLLTRNAKTGTSLLMNNFATRTLYNLGVEGVLQEGGLNYYAQKKGEAYANDEGYSLVADFISKDFESKEGMENLAMGSFMGTSQGLAMDVFSGKLASDFKRYNQYRTFMNDMKELSSYTGKDEIKNLINFNTDTKNIERYQKLEKLTEQKISALETQLKSAKTRKEKSEIKDKIVDAQRTLVAENQKLISTKINNAVHTGTVDKLINTLEILSQKEDLTEDERAEIKAHIPMVKAMEQEYVAHQDMKNTGTIITNRYNSIINKKQLDKLDQLITTSEVGREEALKKHARIKAREASRMFKAKPIEGSPEVAQWKDTTKAYKERYENFYNTLKESIDNGDDLGDADIRSYNQLVKQREDLQDLIDKNDVEYNRLTSREYQDKYDDTVSYKNEVTKAMFEEEKKGTNNSFFGKLRNKKPKELPEILSKLREKYKSTLSVSEMEALENEANTKYNNLKAFQDELAQREAQAAAEKEAQELLEAEKAVADAKDLEKKRTEIEEEEGALPDEDNEAIKTFVPKGSTPGKARFTENARQEAHAREAELKEKQESGKLNEQEETELNQVTKSIDDDNIQQQSLRLFGTTTLKRNPRFKSGTAENITVSPGEGLASTASAASMNSVNVNEDIEDDAFTLKPKDDEQSHDNLREFANSVVAILARQNKTNTNNIGIEDYINYMIDVQGSDFVKAHWEGIAFAYKLYRPEDTTDTDKLFDIMFTERSDLFSKLTNSMVDDGEVDSRPQGDSVVIKKLDEPTEESPTATTEVTTTVEEVTSDTEGPLVNDNAKVQKSNNRLTSKSLLNVFSRWMANSYKSFGLDKNYFFDFKNFEKAKSNKLDITFRIPTEKDFQDITLGELYIQSDADNKFKPIKFSTWEKINGFVNKSLSEKMKDPKWISKVPIVGFNSDNKPVMLLNNGDFATEMDILEFPASMPQEERDALKEHANRANMSLRENVIKNGSHTAKVKIDFKDEGKYDSTGKRPKRLFSTEPKDSVKEKRVMLGNFIASDFTFKSGGEIIETNNSDFDKFKAGTPVVIRQTGVNEDGSPIYQAMKADVAPYSRAHISSIINAITVYMSSKLEDSDLQGAGKFLQFRDRVKEEGGIDLKQHNGLIQYLDRIVTRGSFTHIAEQKQLKDPDEIRTEFAKFMNSKTNSARPGQVTFAYVNFKVAAVIKPENDVPVRPEDVILLDPRDVNSLEDLAAVDDILTIIGDALHKSPNKVNLSTLRTASLTRKFFLFDQAEDENSEDEIIEFENYQEFAGTVTYIPGSFSSVESEGEIGYKREDGTSFTNQYGYYTMEIEGDFSQSTPREVMEQKVKESKEKNTKEEVKKKVEKEIKETKETPEPEKVEALVEETVKKIKALESARDRLASMGKDVTSTQAKIDELKGSLPEDYNDEAFSTKPISEEQITEMQEKLAEQSKNVEGLNIGQKLDIIDYLFHNIAASIGYKKGSKISKTKILKDLRTSITDFIDHQKQINDETIQDLELLDDPIFQDEIDSIKESNEILANISNSWEFIEEEVLEMLENKVSIKEVKDINKEIEEDDTPDDSDESDTEESDSLDSGQSDDTIEDGNDVGEIEKDYNSSSLEEKGKSTASAKMKRFLAGIPIILKDGSTLTGYLNLTRYYDFKDLDNLIKVHLNSPTEIGSDYQEVLAKLEELSTKYPWAKAVKDKLMDPSTTEQARIEFMYNYTGKHSISSKFVQFTQNKSGFTTQIIDANFNDVARNLRETWKDGVKSEGVIYINDSTGEYVPVPSEVNRLIEEFEALRGELKADGTKEKAPIRLGFNQIPMNRRDEIKDLKAGEEITLSKEEMNESNFKVLTKKLNPTGSTKVNFVGTYVNINVDRAGYITISKDAIDENRVTALSTWLQQVGISLNAGTFVELATNGLHLGRDGKLSFDDLFHDTKSPFVNIYYNLLQTRDKLDKKEVVTYEGFSVLEGTNTRLDALSKIESKYTDQVITKNFKDNGKLISGLPPAKFATDRIKDLKAESSTVRDNLRSLSFNKSSIFMELLDSDSSFRELMKLHHVSVGSMKQKDSRFNLRAKITELTASDLEAAKLAHFFETRNMPGFKSQAIANFSGEGDLRMGNVFLPTMSDKDQMMLLQTVIFNLTESDYKDGQLSERFLDLLFDQLVKPDLERMVNYHALGRTTNIKDYDNAAQLFNLLPFLNNVKTKEGITLTAAIKADPTAFNVDTIKELYADGVRDIKSEINSFFNSEVEKKLADWKKLKITEGNKVRINSEYVKTKPFKRAEDRNRNLAAEFIINNLITNANMHMMVIGDPALYSKSKLFNSKNFILDANGKPDVTKPRDEQNADAIYRQWSESFLGTNLGKRLALMLAPGSKIFNSKNEVYHQIFLNDFVDISNNLVDIIVTAYEDESLRESLQTTIDRYKEINNIISNNKDITKDDVKELEQERKDIRDDLSERFPAVSDYLEIEATDAQEYTTVAEHLHVVKGQGRIDDETYDTILNKIEAQREDLKRDGSINKNNYLTKDELGFVLQPIKPVYTGQIFDKEQDVMRTTYIKSSSFALLPQLTVGTQLDGLRVAMENYEIELAKQSGDKDGKVHRGVRASYETANKVGTNTKALSAFKDNGDFNEEAFTTDSIREASLVLNRNDFRIQQDVPYKSAKGKEDKVSYGTQMMKLLFSNGMLDINSGFFNPDYYGQEDTPSNIGGKELFEKYNEAFLDLVENKKTQLYLELGLNKNGIGVNTEDFKTKLEALLQKEGLNRGYNKNELDSLKLDSTGEFQLPLYLNNQSGKIESMLLSIVAKRVVNHKFPGYSYIAASEAGFKFKKVEDTSLVPGSNRIIYSKDFLKGDGVLEGAVTKKGQFKFAEVLVPSKFRDNNGKLLDLYSKDANGDFMYIDVQEDGRYSLKEDMVDNILKSLPTFRIPSSSHVSLSQVKIVGFLPPEAGDMIVVPKNFTKQKGLDFDVDKENSYHLWTYINASGKVKELTPMRVEKMLQKMDELHEERKNKILSKVPKAEPVDGEETVEEVDLPTDISEALSNLEDNYETRRERFKNEMGQKLIENRIVKIHSSVLSNKNPKVQKKITKVLSMAFAESQAEKISALKEIGNKNEFIKNWSFESSAEKAYTQSNKYFSILSDAYQTKKMFLGSAGQSGIGVYSNFLTMASLMQQYGELGDFALIDPETKSPLTFNIGNQSVRAILGRINTLDGSRSISEVFEELQNTATDNEKAQIMGRTGINNHTIGMFSLLSALGIDKVEVSAALAEETGIQDKNNKGPINMSFGNLLFSQNIVKEFTDKIDDKNSNITDPNFSTPEQILEEMISSLADKLGVDSDMSNNFDLLTGDNMVRNLTGTNPSPDMVNLQVLSMMKMLMGYGDTIRSTQKILNISSNGLGKDLIDAVNNLNVLRTTRADAKLSGFDKLLFTQVTPEDGEKKPLDPKAIFIRKLGWVIPTTPIGGSVVHSLSILDKTWFKYYPYFNYQYESSFNMAARTANIQGYTGRRTDFERLFNKELKKYLIATGDNLFDGDITEERKRLFMDIPGENESLASYLKRVLYDDETSSTISKELKNNPLIRKFTYSINKNSKKNLSMRSPSEIKYNDFNAVVENQESLNRSLVELIETNKPLLPLNGKPYTTRDLAQDLILASYLKGGMQDMSQYVKYVPVAYLDTMGFTDDMRYAFSNIADHLSMERDEEANALIPNRFIRQFFQNNPGEARKVNRDVLTEAGTNLLDLDTIDVTDPELFNEKLKLGKILPNFLSIKQDGVNKGFVLYERVLGTTTYNRLETVGFGTISEYDPKNDKASTIRTIKTTDNLEGLSQPIPKKKSTSAKVDPTFGIKDGGSIRDVVDNIMNSNTDAKEAIKLFADFFTDDIKLTVEKSDLFNGRYRAGSNTITIAQDVLDSKDPDFIAEIVVKELVHAATMNQVKRYYDRKGNPLVEESQISLHVRKIAVMYQNLLKEGFDVRLKEDGPSLGEIIDEFKPGRTQLTPEQNDTYYGFVDIHEFMEMSLTSSTFRTFMDGIASRNKERSFTERLRDILKKVLNIVALQGNKTVSEEVVESVTDMILKENKVKTFGGRISQDVKNEIADKLPEIVSESAQKHVPKDQAKARMATQFIGKGAKNSSTEKYRELYSTYNLENTGKYSSDDIVWVSSNGKRADRVDPFNAKGQLQGVYKNIDKAIAAGARIVMDTGKHVKATAFYNVGEVALEKYMRDKDYVRDRFGVWHPARASYSMKNKVVEGLLDRAQDQLSNTKKDLDINFLGEFTKDPLMC